MPSSEPPARFDQSFAAEYDKRYAKLAPLRDALHLLTAAVLAELPGEARVLCVGAGTGAELIALAEKFPRWRFTAVDPAGPMLDVCRRRTAECGVADRCTYHEGFLDTLPPSAPYDAATSLLVSHFILSPEARTAFFRGIAERLRPGGLLVNADLAADVASAEYASLLEVWLELMKATDQPPEKIAALRLAYTRDVALLPPARVSALVASGGFEPPVLFLQTGLIHAWYAKRAANTR